MKLLALIKKEFLRFFRDPKLIVTMLLPGLVIYLLYSMMGSLIWSGEESYDFNVQTVGSSVQLETVLKTAISGEEDFTLTVAEATSEEDAIAKVKSGELTALITFSPDFDQKMLAYTPLLGQEAPQVRIYYRSDDTVSYTFYAFASSVFEGYESLISNKFDVNGGEGNFDLAEQSDMDMLMSTLGGIIPFLAVALIFSSCMGVTLESVAGEKERGTLATILVTPVKRSHVAIGKVLPLSCVALLGAISSFLGIALSLPTLAGINLGTMTASYGFMTYLWIFLLIMSIVPLIVACVSVISTVAKTVKEASAYVSVVMILIMVVSLVSTFAPQMGWWVIFVPILNAVAMMGQALSLSVVAWQAIVTIVMNVVYTAGLIVVMAKLLSSERIMFGK